MQQISTYILSVGAAGLLCAIIARLPGKDSMTGKVIQLVAGLFMLLVILRPFGNFRMDGFLDPLQEYKCQAQAAVDRGQEQSSLAFQNSIKEQLAAYILDKGAALGAKLTAQIHLDGSFPPNVLSVQLSGDISPYAKQAITEQMCRELGLSGEDIQWQ